ncbi:unnamed protein product [Caenorhabditis bovis]|uniref:Uncharacterized protein n=1 Tax=Caenorhabditis bovis TaxID=2654633 RepID=A0A8S1F3C6_9PELO|nr:unnamed protein product [Caenorhabditis bovis]
MNDEDILYDLALETLYEENLANPAEFPKKTEEKKDKIADEIRKLLIGFRETVKSLENEVKEAKENLKNAAQAAGIVVCPNCNHHFKDRHHLLRPLNMKVFRASRCVEIEFRTVEDLNTWLYLNQLEMNSDGIPTILKKSNPEPRTETLNSLGSKMHDLVRKRKIAKEGDNNGLEKNTRKISKRPLLNEAKPLEHRSAVKIETIPPRVKKPVEKHIENKFVQPKSVNDEKRTGNRISNRAECSRDVDRKDDRRRQLCGNVDVSKYYGQRLEAGKYDDKDFKANPIESASRFQTNNKDRGETVQRFGIQRSESGRKSSEYCQQPRQCTAENSRRNQTKKPQRIENVLNSSSACNDPVPEPTRKVRRKIVFDEDPSTQPPPKLHAPIVDKAVTYKVPVKSAPAVYKVPVRRTSLNNPTYKVPVTKSVATVATTKFSTKDISEISSEKPKKLNEAISDHPDVSAEVEEDEDDMSYWLTGDVEIDSDELSCDDLDFPESASTEVSFTCGEEDEDGSDPMPTKDLNVDIKFDQHLQDETNKSSNYSHLSSPEMKTSGSDEVEELDWGYDDEELYQPSEKPNEEEKNEEQLKEHSDEGEITDDSPASSPSGVPGRQSCEENRPKSRSHHWAKSKNSFVKNNGMLKRLHFNVQSQ